VLKKQIYGISIPNFLFFSNLPIPYEKLPSLLKIKIASHELTDYFYIQYQ
jgi:hypothetical protein